MTQSQPERSPAEPRMWLSELAIAQPVLITMAVVVAVVVGILGYRAMPVDYFPTITFPIVAIQTVYPGASPEEVERDVSKPLEDAVASIAGIDSIASTSSDSISSVIVFFKQGQDVKAASADVRSRIDLIRNTLPADVRDPVTQLYDPLALPILSVAVSDRSGTRAPEELRAVVDELLRPRLEQVDGIASVTLTGGRVRQINVDLSLDRMVALGASPQQIIAVLGGQNVNVPGGRVGGASERLVRTVGEFTSIDEIADTRVPLANGAQIPLRELARVSDGTAEVRSTSRLDGEQSVVLTLQKRSGTNTVEVAKRAKDQLARLQAANPDLLVTIAVDQSTFTEESLADVERSLVLGAIFAALVVLLFFRDVRNTIVTVAGLPAVLLVTFAILNALGVTLNVLSMLGLSLSVGLLVDDAIVVRENIFRRMEHGDEPRHAARVGTAEIALAVLAVSSTIIAVFLPIAFTSGLIGSFLHDFGLTISVAVIVSMIEAFTLAPMLSAYLFQALPQQGGRTPTGWVSRLPVIDFDEPYRRALGWALAHRGRTVGVAFGLFAVSLLAVPFIPNALVTQPDQGEFRVGITLPPGSPLERTDAVARAVETVLRSRPEVAHVFTTVGGNFVEKAAIQVRLTSRQGTARVLQVLRPAIEAAAGPEVTLSTAVAAVTVGGGSSSDSFAASAAVQLAVRGPDLAELDRVSLALADRIAQVPGAIDVTRNVGEGDPGIDVRIDRSRAANVGISTAQLGSTVQAMVNGRTVTSFRAGTRSFDVVARLQESDRASLADLLRLPIVTPLGAQVPLAAVASLASVDRPTQISRQDRQDQIVVSAGALGRDNASVLADSQKAAAELARSLPPGVTIVPVGAAAQMADSLSGFLLALGLGVLFVYVILASQFGHFVHPFTIMVALPFSAIGALLGLLAARKSLDMLALIGLLLLMGLVTKNSILLVDRANRAVRAGRTAREAVLEAGPARLRAIIMTTLAMVLGMIPVASGLGIGGELRQSMGVAVIGGLTTSTLLTLIVVPVVYTLIDDLGQWITRGRRLASVVSTAPASDNATAEGSEP